MQKVIHNRENLHIVFDYLDKLYCETSEINEYKSSNLFKIHYPWFFKYLIKTFIDYNSKFTDGLYEYWDVDERMYKQANFIVEKGKKTMINSKHGERYDDFDIVLTKSSEVE